MILAVIPARGGSKGIPRKNLATVGGMPLVAHSIVHASRSSRVDLTVVSTDDDEIAEVSSQYGATVVRRPPELASDQAASEPAVKHALDVVRTEHGPVELVVFLQPTSPIRQPGDIDAAIERLESAGADSMFSACRLHGFVWRARGGSVESLSYDSAARPRRQDIDSEDWTENGSFYVFRPWVLDTLGNRLGGVIDVWPMHALDSFEVDEPQDLEIVQALYDLRASSPGSDAA